MYTFKVYISCMKTGKWGQRELNPHDCLKSTDFHLTTIFIVRRELSLQEGLSLYSRRYNFSYY